MSRQQLTLNVASSDADYVASLLTLAGAESVAFADSGDDPVLEPEPGTMPLWDTVCLRAVFPDSQNLAPVTSLLRNLPSSSGIDVSTLADAHWQEAIRQVFCARPIGRRVWLAPADERRAPEGRTLVRLYMGLAFGTGEHPTTAMCLEWLDAKFRRGETLLDYGCGSGVLAITALKLGAHRAWAVDTDTQAVSATIANADLNEVRPHLFVGTPAELPIQTADVLAANILAGPLIALAPELAARIRPGGKLVLSGLLEAQAKAVVAAYTPFCGDFAYESEGGWLLVTATRLPTDRGLTR